MALIPPPGPLPSPARHSDRRREGVIPPLLLPKRKRRRTGEGARKAGRERALARSRPGGIPRLWAELAFQRRAKWLRGRRPLPMCKALRRAMVV